MINTLAFISPGGGELILIMLVLIMLFGSKDAPRILRKFQNVMDEIRRIANGFRYDMMYSDLHSDEPDDSTSPEPAPDAEIEDGEFEEYDESEEYNFEQDYGDADEAEPDETPDERDEVS